MRYKNQINKDPGIIALFIRYMIYIKKLTDFTDSIFCLFPFYVLRI